MSEPFTDADVQLVAEAVWQKLKDTDFPNLSGPPSDACFEDARAILAALAEAGRLTPDGGVLRERWQVQYLDKAFTERHAAYFDSRPDADECVATVSASARFSDIKLLHKISTPWVVADEGSTP